MPSDSDTLVLGCGELRVPGAVHVDRNPANNPDVVHDLDVYPWPFAGRRFRRIVCEHVLEHLNEPDRALREMRRVMADGAELEIVTPHYSSPESWNDLTHRYHFGMSAFKPYYAGSYGTPKLFDLAARKLAFGKGLPAWPARLIAALSLSFYEKYFAFLLPARNMTVRLRAAAPPRREMRAALPEKRLLGRETQASERRTFWALGAFALLMLLPGAGSPSQLAHGDVYNFVLRVVVGMMETGDLLTPHMGPLIDFSKPPLFHWTLLGAIKLLGPWWGLRLPSILCSTGTVLLTYAFGRLLGLGRDRSLAAALLWLASGAMAAYGRQPLLEAPLALTMLASFYGLVRACGEKNVRWLYLFGAALGASSMVKWLQGPASIAVFAAIYLVGTGSWRRLLKHRRHLAGAIGLAALIALPWPLAVGLTHADFFMRQLRLELFTQRFQSADVTTIPDTLGRGLLLGILPWTFLAIPLLRRIGRLKGHTAWPLAAWIAAGLGPTLLISARTSRCAFAGLPGVLLAIAALWDPEDKWWGGALRACGLIFALAFVGTFGMTRQIGLTPTWLLVAGNAAAAACLLFAWRRHLVLSACAAAFGFMLISGPLIKRVGFNVIPPDVIAAVGERPVGMYLSGPESAGTGYMQLYLRRSMYIFNEDEVDRMIETGSLLMVSGSYLGRLEKQLAPRGIGTRVLAEWSSPRTNLQPPALLKALVSKSLDPIQVRHRLIELLPNRTADGDRASAERPKG